MLHSIVALLFGCRHRQITRPITPVHKVGTPAEETYVACLACGQRLRYDLETMSIGRPLPQPAPQSSTASSFQAS